MQMISMINKPYKTRGAILSLEEANEIFSQQKDLYGFFMDIS